MDIMQGLIYGMIIVILGTVVLAVLSYGAFKLRDAGKRTPVSSQSSGGPLFFERVTFSADDGHAGQDRV